MILNSCQTPIQHHTVVVALSVRPQISAKSESKPGGRIGRRAYATKESIPASTQSLSLVRACV